MIKDLRVGMADGDTRRHYYEMQGSSPLRYCTMSKTLWFLVLLSGVGPDCKRCLTKKQSIYDINTP